MKEISLHILDLVQNSIQADAKKISIQIYEDIVNDCYEVIISDNGAGMNEETKQNILDPFFTTKNKKTGLGIPLLKQHTELTGGNIQIKSELGKGTEVRAIFSHKHLDRQPLGDITGTLVGLIRSYPNLDFEYQHKISSKKFIFSTLEIKKELEGIPIESKEVITFINQLLNENIKAINST